MFCLKFFLALTFALCLFPCFSCAATVHDSVAFTSTHSSQVVTSFTGDLTLSTTNQFTLLPSNDFIYAVNVSFATTSEVIYPSEFTMRIVYSTCSSDTECDTALTVFEGRGGDSMDAVNMTGVGSEGGFFAMSTNDPNCNIRPMLNKAATLVYERNMTTLDGFFVYVVVDIFNGDAGLFNLTITDCGTSCLEFGATYLNPCACAVCADGFERQEDGSCLLVDCVDYASNAPACSCDEDYTDAFSWNVTAATWDGMCVADCSNAPDCGAELHREECLLTAHTCSECLPGFVANGTDLNKACLQCADALCLSCTDAEVGSCTECNGEDIVLEGGVCSECCDRQNKAWHEIQILSSSEVDPGGDRFGNGVALNTHGWAMVGAYLETTHAFESGAVYVYYLNDLLGIWQETQKLVADDIDGHDYTSAYFGVSIVINSNNIAIVSASHDNADVNGATDGGAAYVFALNEDTGMWDQVTKLVPGDIGSGDRFGNEGMCLNAWNIAVIGSPLSNIDNKGSAAVFGEQVPGVWEHLDNLEAEDGAANDYFGEKGTDIDDDNVIFVGAASASANSVDSGTVYVFMESASGSNEWEQVQKIVATGGSTYAFFGASISLSGETLLVGAYTDDHASGNTNANYGAAYLFEEQVDGSWGQVKQFQADIPGIDNYFGRTVKLQGSLAVIGAYGYDSLKGAVYVFLEDAGDWIQHSIITASSGGNGDKFSDGGTIALLGTRLLIGAYIGGEAYWFELDCTAPTFVECPTSTSVVASDPFQLEWTSNVTDLIDPDPQVECNVPLDFAFPISETTHVICSATDQDNNTATCEFDVSVIIPRGTLYFSSCATSGDFSASFTLLSETSLDLEIKKLNGEDIIIQYTVMEDSDSSIDLVHVNMSYATVESNSTECPNGDITVETHGDCIWEYIGDDTWLVCPSSIGSNTLRTIAEASGSSSVLGVNLDGGSIVFDGKHLYPAAADHTIVTVWFGDFTIGQVTACGSVVATGTSISCVVPPLNKDWMVAQNLQFQVNVTSLISGITLSSQLSADVYHYPVAPNITAVYGCGSTKNATGCHTIGGDVVTILGFDLDLATDVTVDGLDCDIQDHVDDNTLTCTLPANDGANRAVVAYQNSVASEPAFLVSYAVPNVTSVSGCPNNTDTSTFNCPDEPIDGQVTTLTITGTDFGSEVSAVFIGTQQALSVETHNNSIIYCTLPKGGGEDNSIMIVQKNGQVAVAQNSFVSYKPCPDGTYLNGAECDPCDKGYYTNDKTIKTQCVACNLGEYQDQTGQTDCKDCDAGRFSEQLATNYSCTDCSIGTFSLDGASECRGCSADTQYAPEEGMSQCINCPPRAVRRSDDVSQCYCDTLSYWDTLQSDTELICEPCDTRWYNCSQPGYTLETLILMPGYWRSSSSIYEPEECFSPEMCPGGAFDASLTAEDDDELCAFPRTGPMCAQCVKGYIADALTSPCEECMDSSLQLLFFIVAGFVALVFCGYYVHKTLKKADKEKGEISTLGKIMVSAFQINSIAISFAFVWEGAFNDFIAAESAASSLGTSALNFSCLTVSDGDGLKAVYIETLLYLLSGVFVSVLPNIFLVPYLRYTSARVDVWVDVKENLINIYRVALPIVFFLLHPTLTQRTMNLFHCTDINGTLYLTQQLDEECWEGDHLAWVFSAGILMIVFYVLGLPLAAVYFLYKNQEKIHADHPDYTTFHRNYSFLYKGYAVDTIGKDHYSWAWEAVVTARKVFLMFILVFFANDAHLQSLLGLLGMMIALSTHAYAMPFESSLLNAAEFISLLCSFITFYLGQFTYVQDTDPDVRLTASWMALIVNVGFLLVMLGFMIYSAKEKRDAKKEVERIRAQSEAAGDRLEDDDIKNVRDKGSDRRRQTSAEYRHYRANSQQQYRIRGFTTELKDIEMTTISEEQMVGGDDVAMSVNELKQDHESEPSPALPSTAPVEATPLPDGWTEHPLKPVSS